MTTAEPLPLYIQDQVPQSPFDMLMTRIAVPISATHPDAHIILESFVDSRKAPAYDGPGTSKSHEPIDHYPLYPLVEGGHIANVLTCVQQQIVKELFNAIRREDAQAIALLIQHNLVTANTTSETGQTPLLEAISTKNIAIVKEILEFGADCNKFGVVTSGYHKATRTPLMLAASLDSLPIVKLLFEPPYSANDALVAPDGQIALRLAAENEDRAIVDYLPSRRAGGYLRFKTHHAASIERIKKTFRQIVAFIKFFVWHLPKFFIWDIPKHLVVLPVVRGCKWCWANRKKIGLWCKHQLTETPNRVAKLGKTTWQTAKKVPQAIWKVAKKIPEVIWKVAKETPDAIWKAIKEVSKAVREIGKAVWKLLTVRIPKATLIALKWTWEGMSSLARAIGNIFLRILSFLHTVFEAIVTSLRNVTLKDIWNAFCDFLRAVFVGVPKTLWSWIKNFVDVSYGFMKALLGWFGVLLWCIVVGLQYVAVYLPSRFGIILLSVGSSFAKALSEIRVWISPKA